MKIHDRLSAITGAMIGFLIYSWFSYKVFDKILLGASILTFVVGIIFAIIDRKKERGKRK